MTTLIESDPPDCGPSIIPRWAWEPSTAAGRLFRLRRGRSARVSPRLFPRPDVRFPQRAPRERSQICAYTSAAPALHTPVPVRDSGVGAAPYLVAVQAQLRPVPRAPLSFRLIYRKTSGYLKPCTRARNLVPQGCWLVRCTRTKLPAIVSGLSNIRPVPQLYRLPLPTLALRHSPQTGAKTAMGMTGRGRTTAGRRPESGHNRSSLRFTIAAPLRLR